MKAFVAILFRLQKLMTVCAGVALTSIMCLTVADVLLRFFIKPITGSYEIISLLGTIVIGFALPFSFWVKSHVYADFLVDRLPRWKKNIFLVFTKLLGIGFFVILGCSLLNKGMLIAESGEVSPILLIPFHPVAHGLAVCSFIVSLVLLLDMIKIIGRQYE
jgi:TRAP-type C4-dicarboxylate transport system permease small subunit